MKVSGYILMTRAVFYSDVENILTLIFTTNSIMKKVFTWHVVSVKFDDQIQAMLIFNQS